MHSFMDSKLMAKLLRQALAERKIELSHSDCLELVARQYGLPNWNVLSARIEAAQLASQPLPMPTGWVDGSVQKNGHFRMGLDVNFPSCAVIASTPKADHSAEDEFGTLSQSFSAEEFRGQAVLLQAELRCAAVIGEATIWLRIDGPQGRVLRFDNLMDRPGATIDGTSDWVQREILLDVPNDAVSILFGFLLKGRGSVWARNVRIEPRPTTSIEKPRPPYRHDRPTNLDFSQVN